MPQLSDMPSKMLSARPPVTAAAIDTLLGPSAGRYFGEGYKRVEQRLLQVDVTPACGGAAGVVSADAAVSYPADWSTKRDGQPTPHLGTLDALLIAVQLSEAYLVHAHQLDPQQQARIWLRGFTMRAGSAPHESLTSFRVSARVTPAEQCPAGVEDNRIQSECSVGAIKVCCDIEHPIRGERGKPGRYADAAERIGCGADRYWGAGYREIERQITDIRLDAKTGYADATVMLVPRGEIPHRGIEASYQHNVSMVDAILVLAQLSQAYLYDMDRISRAETEMLWMRKVTMAAETPYRSCRNPLIASAASRRSSLIRFDGGDWRTADMFAHFGGIDVAYSLAHRLPGDRT